MKQEHDAEGNVTAVDSGTTAVYTYDGGWRTLLICQNILGAPSFAFSSEGWATTNLNRFFSRVNTVCLR